MELLSELTPWTPKAIARSVEAHHWPPPTYWIRDMLTDIASAWAADRKRIEALERGDMVIRLLLQRVLCDCQPRALDDVAITSVASTHDFGCAYRREMQPVLAALRGEEET